MKPEQIVVGGVYGSARMPGVAVTVTHISSPRPGARRVHYRYIGSRGFEMHSTTGMLRFAHLARKSVDAEAGA